MKIKTTDFELHQKVKVDDHEAIGTITEISNIEFNKRNTAYYWITFPDADRVKYPEVGYVKTGQRIEFGDEHRMVLQ